MQVIGVAENVAYRDDQLIMTAVGFADGKQVDRSVMSTTSEIASGVNPVTTGNDRSLVRVLMQSSWLSRAPVQRRELRYGSQEFLAASDLARRMPSSPRVSTLIGYMVRDPALVRVLLAVWRLPVVELRVRRADIEAWSGADFGPARRARVAQAVLELPTVEGKYLAGLDKQALRTNLRHARELGVTSARVPTYEAWIEAVRIILDARGDAESVDWEMDKPEPGQQVAYYVTRDAQGSPLAFARAALFGQFAVLFSMFSIDRHPSASWARYQLHTVLALDLGCSEVKHLLVGSALQESTGAQYFQHLLGYRARNLHMDVIKSDATKLVVAREGAEANAG